MKFQQVAVVLLFTKTFVFVIGHPTGAPGCSPVPQHGFDPQETPSPYTVTVNTNTIQTGEQVEVTLSGKESFKGFFIQALDGKEDAVGTFVVENRNDYQTKSCGSGKNNTATHTESSEKQSIKLLWKAEDVTEDVTFVCTFVKNFKTYWVGVKAQKLGVSK